jgi:hypothetical protein
MGTAAVGLVLGFAVWRGNSGRKLRPAAPASAAENVGTPLARINERIRRSIPEALSELQAFLAAREPSKALSAGEAAEWIATLTSIRAGFLNFAPPARGSAGMLSTMVLNKFAVEPAPPSWLDALPLIHSVMSACMSDSEPVVRVVGLNEVAKLWAWIPGRSLTPYEEQALADWKRALYQPVVRCLAGRDAATRVAAVACLGALPFDEAAAPAVAYLEDQQSLDVRKQTLVSFAQRPALLTAEMLLKRVHDQDMAIRETALAVLKARGLTSEQIRLGSLIFHPQAELRLSVIPQLKERTDIDPVIWLLELSRDPVDAVRIGAIRALADQKDRPVSVNRRLAELATSDRSEDVRQAARQFVPSIDETTASLPPLPGSSALNPRAN